MSIYFQFKSSTVRESIDIDGHFISVGELREKIIETKLSSNRNRKRDSNIVVSNYDTMEDYTDDSTLIPRNSTVWVRRVPMSNSPPIIASPARVPVEEPKAVEIDPEEQEWNELLDVINGKSEPTLPGNAAASETGEESRIKALVETPALGWQGYGGGFGWNAPPPGYVCHRCKVAGHFIQHCPTNGDPAYDIKKFVRPPTAVLRPNEAAFDRGMEGVSSSSRSADQLPPELHCRLCKQVMKDAVLTSRCCFDSFCDRCIRGHIISKSSCVCGATNVLADHLIPNLTLRNTISRILESKSSSSSSGEGASQHDATSQQVLPPPEKESVTLPKAAESQESAPLVNEAVEQKPEAPKEMKTALPVPMPMPVAANNNYMMPPMGYNPYWGGFMPPYAGYGYGYGYNYGYGPMMNQPVRGEQGKKPSTVVVLNAESREATAKRKRDEDQDHGREVRSRLSDKPSSQLPNKKVEHHHSDHSRRRDPRDERICGDVSSSKIRLSDRPSSQLPNKKVEHRHSDHSRRRDPRDDRYQRDERHHHSRASSSHHRSESTKTVTAAESKRAIPTKEAALKRKLSSSSSNGRYEHKAASVGSRKSTIPSHAPVSLAYDEGSDDDDDRHFKRRSSWSKSSPPAPRLMRVV